MTASLELLDRELILAGLTGEDRARVSRLELHPVLDSTNAYLLAQARAGWPSGVVCLAERQTAGRGRLGRDWLTPFGAGLAFSLLWRFETQPEALSGLSLATGIAVARGLRDVGVTEVGLKWPNDVWWRGRKLGGILLESGVTADSVHVVAGIGINIALPGEEATVIDQPWVDLREILGTGRIARNRLASSLIGELIRIFAGFERDGFAGLAAEWARFDQVAGRRVSLRLANTLITGVARGVDATGALLLESADGVITPYIGGEISLRVEP